MRRRKPLQATESDWHDGVHMIVWIAPFRSTLDLKFFYPTTSSCISKAAMALATVVESTTLPHSAKELLVVISTDFC
jgi:hypothetical protein